MHRRLLALAAAVVAAPAIARSVPEAQRRHRVLAADGVQLCACESRSGGHGWVFKGPEAALFDAGGRQAGTHGAGPSGATPRPR